MCRFAVRQNGAPAGAATTASPPQEAIDMSFLYQEGTEDLDANGERRQRRGGGRGLAT